MRIRQILWLAPLFVGGLVVAVVNGQDSSRRSVLVSPRPAASVQGEPTPAARPPVLATPTPAASSIAAPTLAAPQSQTATSRVASRPLSDAAAKPPINSAPAKLSDRLRTIRQSMTGSSVNLGTLQGGSPSDISTSRTLSGNSGARTIPGFISQPAAPKADPKPIVSSPAPAAEIIEKPKAERINDARPIVSAPRSKQLLVSRGPILRVEANGPASVKIGKSAAYTFSLINEGNDTANNALVRVSLPASVQLDAILSSVGTVNRDAMSANGVRQLIWKVDSLAGNGRERLTVNLLPKSTQPIQMAVDWTFAPLAMTAKVAVQEPKLEMRVSGPSELLFGESKLYTISLSNPGDGVSENVKLLLEVGGKRAETMEIGNLAPGQVRDVEISMAATKAGPMNMNLVAIGEGGLRSQAKQAITVRRAKLEVAVLGPQHKFAGSVASYKIVVTNRGDATANDLVTAAILPRGAKTLANDSLSWKIGSLPAGSKREFVVRCQLGEAGQNNFEARAQAQGGLADSTVLATTVEAVADLKLEVLDPKGPLPIGENVAYDVIISNRGSKAASNIKLQAQFSNGIEPIAVEGHKGEIVPGQVLFDNIGRINAGEKLTVRIKAKAETEGNHIFRATVTLDQPQTRLVSEESTHFFADDFGKENIKSVGSKPLTSDIR